MQSAPFSINNTHYSYRTLEGSDSVHIKGASIVFAYSSTVEIIIDNDQVITLPEKSFLELPPCSRIAYTLERKGYVVILTNEQLQPLSNLLQLKSLESEAYEVTKPWGRELWLTGKSPKYSMVLKLIEIKKGTKTSLQVHRFKYESNFLCQGEAIFRHSEEKYRGKEFNYTIEEVKISAPTVIDVEPMTIHQVEAFTDIILIEASTDYLEDVIRLQDDTGRQDGKVESEHAG